MNTVQFEFYQIKQFYYNNDRVTGTSSSHFKVFNTRLGPFNKAWTGYKDWACQ